jgi:hypothetical protein
LLRRAKMAIAVDADWRRGPALGGTQSNKSSLTYF